MEEDHEFDGSADGFELGVSGSSYTDLRGDLSGSPLCCTPVTYVSELNVGDHIIFLTPDSVPGYRPSYQSALIDKAEKIELQFISYCRGGIYEDRVEFGSLGKVFRVDYTRCRYGSRRALARARARMEMGEDHYHVLYNNSHFLVSWCKTGSEHSLVSILDSLAYDESRHYPLNPILSRENVTTLSEINPGDHVIMKSTHYLIDSIHDKGMDGQNYFTAFTINGKGFVMKEGHAVLSGDTAKITYDQQSNSYHPGKAREQAEKELVKRSKWGGSDQFVTIMKCGKKHVLTERCFFHESADAVGCTQVTPHTSVDIGDHLLVRGTFGGFRSVLVHSCIDDHTVVSIPSVHKKDLMGRLNLLDYNEVYRVNYSQSLPADEILKRACSPEGEEILKQGDGGESTFFVTWAKMGKGLSLNLSKLIQKRQVGLVRPQRYEKIVSIDDVVVGDHLFIPNPAYRWHFLVSEKTHSCKASAPVFKVIYLLRGSIKETEEVLDPVKDDIFRIVYNEEFPPSAAVQRARTAVGKVNLSPTARMWFVRWAKTGSEEGLEVDFLAKRSLPVVKSRLACFTQLDPGDYLVVDKGKFIPRHHYIVTRVISPTECSVVGTWKGKMTESRVRLEEGVCHKLVYEEGTCLCASECVRRARDVVGSPFALKYMRRKLINLIKTTDSTEVDVENLPEERLLLRRERVESALDLAPGDHLEVPEKVLQKVSYRSLIVADVKDENTVRVLCVSKKAIVETEFCLVKQMGEEEDKEGGEMGVATVGDLKEVYRVKYVERINRRHGLDMLRRAMAERRTDKPLEHLLALATVGEPVSLELDPHLHKVLEYRKEDIRRPVAMSKLRSASIEIGTRATVHAAFKIGAQVALSSTRVGGFIGFGPGISILAEAPIFTRRLYKLGRQKKFDQISEEDYKRGVIQQSFTSANTVLGATAGVVVGQLAIPVPVLGGLVGGALGTAAGNGLGRLEGWAASKLVKDAPVPTLPALLNFVFLELPEENS